MTRQTRAHTNWATGEPNNISGQNGTGCEDALQYRTLELGLPLQQNSIAERQFDQIIKVAGVKRITFHWMRHT